MADLDELLEDLAGTHPPVPVDRIKDTLRRRRNRRRLLRGSAVVVAAVCIGAAVMAQHADGPTSVHTIDDPEPTSPVAVPVPTVPEPGDPAFWTASASADGRPRIDASSFTATVTRLGCNDGHTGAAGRPGVVVTDAEVIITFTVEPVDGDGDGGFDATCPGNDHVTYDVDLGQPLGRRTLVDGGCRPGGAGHGSPLCEGGGKRWDPPRTAAQLATYQRAVATGIKCYEDLGATVYGPWAGADGYQYHFDYTVTADRAAEQRCDDDLYGFKDRSPDPVLVSSTPDPAMFDVLVRQLECLPDGFDTGSFDRPLPTNRSELEHLSSDAAASLDAAMANAFETQSQPVMNCLRQASGIPLR